MRQCATLLLAVGAVFFTGAHAHTSPLDCTSPTPLVCNQPLNDTTVGSANTGSLYPCAPSTTYDGPERVYRFQNSSLQTVSFLLSGAPADLDIGLIMADPPGGCDTDACMAVADSQILTRDLQPGSYYLVVDGKNGAAGPFVLTAMCGSNMFPPSITATLDPDDPDPANDCVSEVKTVFLNPDPYAVDVLVTVDTTASQQRAINNLRQWSSEILARLDLRLTDVRIGLVSYRDYNGTYSSAPPCTYANIPYGTAGDFPYRLEVPITDDLATFQAAVDGLTIGDGQDTPESTARMLFETYGDDAIGFRRGANRVIIDFSDTGPHDCDYSLCNGTGIPLANVWGVDPGRDRVIGTADDLAMMDVLGQLAARDMLLYHVYTGPAEVGGIPNPLRQPFIDLWGCWTAITGGRSYDSNPVLDTIAVADAIVDAVRPGLDRCAELTLQASPGFEAWLRNLTPMSYVQATLPGVYSFTFDICALPGSGPGSKDFTVDSLCNGRKIAEQRVHIDGPGCNPIFQIQVSPGATCAGTAVSLVGSGSTISGCTGTVEYQWRGDNGFLRPWSTVTNATDFPLLSTSYALDVRCDVPDCEASSTPNLVTVSAPMAQAGPDRDSCPATPIVLGGNPTGSGGVGALDYTWMAVPPDPTMSCTSGPTCTNPSATPAANTTYSLLVTDTQGCVATSMSRVTVGVPSLPPVVGNTLLGVRGLRAIPAEPGSAFFQWTDVAGASTQYNLRRSDAKDFSAPNGILVSLAPPALNARLVSEVFTPPSPRFYRVSASNCAGLEGPF